MKIRSDQSEISARYLANIYSTRIHSLKMLKVRDRERKGGQ